MAIKRMRKRQPKRPRRKANRKSKPTTKVSQMITYNPNRPRPQLFKKTALYLSNGTNILTGTGAAQTFIGGALAASMPDFSSITALYNRYKMRKITYTFNLSTTLQSNGLDGDRMPRMWIRYNYDSNLTGAGVISRLQDSQNVKCFQFTPDKTTYQYSYYPRCIEPVYLSGISTGYKLARPQFIDVQYGTVPHYGIMWSIDGLSTGLVITYDISYEIDFKYSD